MIDLFGEDGGGGFAGGINEHAVGDEALRWASTCGHLEVAKILIP